jgi:hypothetical protein
MASCCASWSTTQVEPGRYLQWHVDTKGVTYPLVRSSHVPDTDQHQISRHGKRLRHNP